jgi:hypothetical protein
MVRKIILEIIFFVGIAPLHGMNPIIKKIFKNPKIQDFLKVNKDSI